MSKLLVTGATGFIGSALCHHLTSQGAQIYALCRRKTHTLPTQVICLEWSGTTEPQNIPEGLDAVINLAGENIAAGRWNTARRKRLRDSRILTTNLLIAGLKKLSSPPPLFLSTSATGLYGDCGEQLLTETAPTGEGFLASLAQDWESSAQQAQTLGCMVTLMRFGVVLSPKGGALARMLLPFRLGLGGRMSTGDQYMSWITLEDLMHAVEYLLHHPTAGAVNLSAPEACQNGEFTRELAQALQRPALIPIPAWLLKLAMGKMANELFLFSTRAYPSRLIEAGFSFSAPSIKQAFERLLQQP